MRVSIVLAICFLGVASASSLNRRSFLDDVQNKTQDAFKNLEHFGQDFQQKLQEALKNLFGHHNSSAESSTEKTVSKRATNPLVLINDLKDPAKFAQDLIKVLADMALQGRRKRDFSEDLKKAVETGKQQAQEAIQKLMDLLNSFKNGASAESSTEKTVSKRATNPLVLINDLKDPAKFAQDLIKVLADMALQGRRKRDFSEDLKKFTDAGKQKAQEAIQKLMDLFNSFKNGASDETSTEKTVAKRDINEDLQKLASAGQEKIQAALKQLQDLFEQFKGGFNHDQASATITKRDISASLQQFGQNAQEKAQAAFSHLREAFENLLKGFKPAEEQSETSTEVSVSKRSIEDFQQRAQEALAGFKNSFQNFFNQFRKPVVAEEDTTESS